MGSYLSSPDTNKCFVDGKKYALCSVRGLRRTQDDRHICEKMGSNTLLCVFDGHGGPYVSQFLQDSFIKYYKTALSNKISIEAAMGKGLEQIDKDLWENGSLLSPYIDPTIPRDISINISESVGSTALCVQISSSSLFVSNVGDSQVVVFKKNGDISFVSKRHDLSDSSEKQRVVQSGAEIKDGYIICGEHGINMTRSIGDHLFKQSNSYLLGVPTNYKYTISPDDEYVVVGCDGLWDTLDKHKSENKNIKEVWNLIKKHEKKNMKSLVPLVDAISDEIILALEGSDNLTFAIYKL